MQRGNRRQQILLQHFQVAEVMGWEDIALHFTEPDFPVIEPPGRRRELIDGHFTGELKRGDPVGQLLRGMGRSVSEHSMEHFHPRTSWASQQSQHEGLRLGDAALANAWGNGRPPRPPLEG